MVHSIVSVLAPICRPAKSIAVGLGVGVAVVLLGCAPRVLRDTDAGYVSAIPSPDASLFDEGAPMCYSLYGFTSVSFGPYARRIIDERRPEDMANLRATLETTDGPRRVVVVERVPFRRCDYALMIAERILAGESAPNRYSFAPFTAYEFRDESRSDVLDRLFGVQRDFRDVEYRYQDEQGNDISERLRKYRFAP